ncbi:MAG: alcohol dehydrogenase catalytic domain-containing protein [Bacteriovoracaceae bacterium]|nr:alcohol dehydrogenase catalytic domain-containing protein [Bacteriovoracaceae bacterium]
MEWFYKFNTETQCFEKDHFSLRELGPQDVSVKPMVVGICGSDLHKISHKIENPALIHEWVGKITKTGKDVTNFKVGQTVTSVACIRCGECSKCLSGGDGCRERKLLGHEGRSVFSSQIQLHCDDVIALSNSENYLKEVLLEVAFVGDSAYECALKMNVVKSDKILIFGAGPVGIFTALAFRERGFDVKVVEISKERLEICRKLNIKAQTFAEALISGEDHDSCDLVIDCTGDSRGAGALNHLAKFCDIYGKIIIVGKYQNAQIPEKEYSGKSLFVTWVANHQRSDFVKSVDFWQERLDPIYHELINIFSPEQINEALESAHSTKSMKCIIDLRKKVTSED